MQRRECVAEWTLRSALSDAFSEDRFWFHKFVFPVEIWVLAMSRRKSGAKKPEADAAGAPPDAWSELRPCVDRLRQANVWVESGAQPLPVSGVTPLGAVDSARLGLNLTFQGSGFDLEG